MTFVETIMLIEERGEETLAQDYRSIITNKHRYLRQLDSSNASPWSEDTEPGAPEKVWGRGGNSYIWKRQEAPDDKPLVLLEGT